MQPVQLSLLPQEYQAPPQIVFCQLPEDQVAEAIGVLAQLIAKAITGGNEVADDE